MRSTIVLALIPACALLFACRAHEAYGPAGDERLETSLSERASDDGADVASLRCDEIDKKFRLMKADDKGEADHVKQMTELFTQSRDNVNKLDDAVARNPDLLYGTAGDAIKSNLDACRSTFADVSSELDRTVRDIADMPVIQEVQGRGTVDVARLDFSVVRSAIEALDPEDKDVLMGKIANGEKRVSGK
jgi:hypothetical protein